MKNRIRYSLSFVLCSLFFVSCDLFTAPKVDLFQQISDEVDWAKAPKLTVRVEYPAVWGTSNPQQGGITPAKDIRKGYEFEIEFTPDQAYSLEGWRAYRSPLPPGWTADLSLVDSIERLDGTAVIVPELPVRGGRGSFTINTTEAVTLVPWCKTEPYVTRTIPRNSPQTLYPRGTDIVVYFNAPLNLSPGAVDLFATGAVKITGNGEDFTGYYNTPVYDSNSDLGTYTITINPSDVPGDSIIEVTVGPNIYNAAGEPMAKPEVFSFSTAPASVGGSITDWGASYNSGTITINWTISGAVDVAPRYRVNSGGDNPLGNNSPAFITGVNPPEASGVRQGNPVSGIREYEIFLDLYVEGIKSNAGSLSFKIWNIPDMNVTPTNTVVLTQSNFALAAASTNNFILTEDITLTNWMPLAGNFTGKFYGNGHTVTIDGMNAAASMGLFGTANNALIRDLTVTVKISDAVGVSNFGGIAANITGTTILNTIVRGTAGVTGGSSSLSAGGLAGFMNTNAAIENCYSDIQLTTENNSGKIYLGGIAGKSGGSINNAVVVASLKMSANNSSTDNEYICGGITGRMSNGHISGSDFAGNIEFPTFDVSGEVSIGGVIGKINGISAQSTIIKTNASGNLIFQNNGSGALYLGGICGRSEGVNDSVNITFENCEYRNGIIEVNSGTGTSSEYRIGGFIGALFLYNELTKCGSRAGGIKVFQNATLKVGGFAGYIQGNLDTCFSTSQIEINATSNNEFFIGGFGGHANSHEIGKTTIKGCFTTGLVTVVKKGSGNTGAAGFVGFGQQGNPPSTGVDFRNCYALGNVSVDQTSGSIHAAGFLAYTENSTVNVSNCFAAGSVLAQSLSDASISAGGLFGRATYNPGPTTIMWDSAALGGSITAKTSGNKNLGRVFGQLHITPGGSNNYALDTMRIERSNDNKTLSYPFWDGSASEPYYTIPNSVDNASNNGANASASTFKSQSFWQTTLHFGTEWNFSGVTSRGYPALAWE